jgi:class 3 adenylate cyclase/tetratricopeptide (TPR) repeat protein
VCPGCGHPNRAGSRFCNECGRALTDAGRFASPESYTPKHLVARILMSRAALEGERKQVTVLFADMKGSMELLAGRDPEEARRLLDPVLERMMDGVHRFEGTVNQVMGDGIMALFGAPIAHEDHAVRACYAALWMQEAVARYSEELSETVGGDVRIRVGLNSGEVVVRSIGSDLHVDYTAVGQTTHIASRVEQLATPGRSCLTRNTLRLAEGYVEVRSLGEVPIKGLSGAIEVYELTGAGRAHTRIHAAARRGLGRFVGRDPELGQLGQALAEAQRGHGQVVAVVGEAGMGKSRLLYELAHSPRMHGWSVLDTYCVSYGKTVPYLPVVELLKSYFQIDARDDVRKIAERVVGKVLTLDPLLEPIVPALLALLDVPCDDPAWDGLDPRQRRERTLDAVTRLLVRDARVQPLLVIVEDLHWADSETGALLESLVGVLAGAAILLLVSYRPEYQHAWSGPVVRVDALPQASAETLLDAALGSDVELDPLKRLLLLKTERNPFFLEETVRMLVETGVLSGDPGAYRLASAVEDVDVPATVQTLLAARIDRMAPEQKALLQCASVIGHDVPVTVLEAIADMTPEDLGHTLASLHAAEVLDQTKLFPDLEYAFKHALTQDVAYASLLGDRRRALHAAIVRAIERLYPGRIAEHCERLAHHALRGDLWPDALRYAREAGAKALGRSVHRDAARWFERALRALDRLPPTRETLESAIDIRFDIRNALLPVGEVDAVLAHLREAEQFAARLGDRHRAAWVTGYMSACFWSLGDYRRSLALAGETRTRACAAGDRSLQVYADLALTWTSHSLGQYEEGARYGLEAIEVLDKQDVDERPGIPSMPTVIARSWLALCLGERGDFSAALTHGEAAMRLAEAVGEPWSLVSAYLALGGVQLRKALTGAAVETLERGLAVVRRFDIDVGFPPIASSLGYALALSGDLTRGLALLRDAAQRVTQTRLKFYWSLTRLWLAEASLLAGAIDDARAHAARALEGARAHGEAGNEAYALDLLGQIVAREGGSEIEAAREHVQRALAIALDHGMRPLAARCYLRLGTLGLRSPGGVDVEHDLRAARRMFHDCGIGPGVAAADAALREAGIRPA